MNALIVDAALTAEVSALRSKVAEHTKLFASVLKILEKTQIIQFKIAIFFSTLSTATRFRHLVSTITGCSTFQKSRPFMHHLMASVLEN